MTGPCRPAPGGPHILWVLVFVQDGTLPQCQSLGGECPNEPEIIQAPIPQPPMLVGRNRICDPAPSQELLSSELGDNNSSYMGRSSLGTRSSRPSKTTKS